ncbi:LysR family transcriptional regulator [Acidaminococcus timonensis]|uniref:LysR family transcriptional regulator n=1 Tax=Acidaminococcus timonensis TaxID=1871002 RepID=UPI002596323D|nr:LysR family transcriptional regulator [uncultured Acidaminococcus sp.]
MNLSLKQLQYLCTLAETRNYHLAAKKLYMTQPALSMAIKKLEADLHGVLFERNTKEVIPTEAGKIAIAYARKILFLNRKMHQEIHNLQQRPRESLRVGTYFILYSLLMPSFIKAIHQIHPQLNLVPSHLHYTALENALQRNALDLILCVQEKPNPLFDTIPLRQDHLLVALSPHHPACAKARQLPGLSYPYLDIRELKQETFYLQYAHQQIRWQEDKLWEAAGFTPKACKEIDSIELSVRLASEGMGAAFTMESYVNALHIQEPVRYFVTGDLKKCPWLSLCTARGHSRSPLIQECIQIIKDLVL